MRKPDFCICENKTQISCSVISCAVFVLLSVTAQMICVFVFASRNWNAAGSHDFCKRMFFLHVQYEFSFRNGNGLRMKMRGFKESTLTNDKILKFANFKNFLGVPIISGISCTF